MELNETLATIGARFRAEREARRWGVGECADRIGSSITTIYYIEKGKSFTMTTYVLACKAFGYPLSYMLSADWRMPTPGDVVPTLQPRQAKILETIAETESISEAREMLGLSEKAMIVNIRRICARLLIPPSYGDDRIPTAIQKARKLQLIKEVSYDKTQ